MIKFLKLAFCVGGCLIVGFIGSGSKEDITIWYQSLVKPPLVPPNFVFPVVWTALYILMGIAVFLIWTLKKKKTTSALILFAIQLFLNYFWSYIFFTKHLPQVAFFEIIFLWITVFLTLKSFRKLSQTAGNLLIPYLLWISFAAYLNLGIVLLNLF